MISVFVACMERGIIKNKVSKTGVLVAPVIELGVGKSLQIQQQSEIFVILGVEGSERMYNRKDHLTS